MMGTERRPPGREAKAEYARPIEKLNETDHDEQRRRHGHQQPTGSRPRAAKGTPMPGARLAVEIDGRLTCSSQPGDGDRGP